ncbi:hypothetical protein [Ensifer sp. SL37]|uniref:hypothetical protein n=1 Tax=Ensifer sp. SL37 TaxID=2995137 RepID=UPI00227263BA|nr:hypothetical protein [Ensifer sp. SL37]MCY1741185.1 hypothetical protein [Ensifer sp. SL37]
MMSRKQRRAAASERRKYKFHGDAMMMVPKAGSYYEMFNSSNEDARSALELMLACMKASANVPENIVTDEELYNSYVELIDRGFVDLIAHFEADHVAVETHLKNPDTGEVWSKAYARAVEVRSVQ